MRAGGLEPSEHPSLPAQSSTEPVLWEELPARQDAAVLRGLGSRVRLQTSPGLNPTQLSALGPVT